MELFTPPGYAHRIGIFFTSACTHSRVETSDQELQVHGVKFIPEPRRQRWEVAIVKDPDGTPSVPASTPALSLADPAKLKAQQTYNSAADSFDARPLGFWARYGRRTVERLGLPAGARVLDVACGTGASALPAAEVVGPAGHVTAVDLAERLLALGREKAKRRGFANIEFLQADMATLGYPDAHFDAVVCVFGIFFVPDMESQLAELWRMVRPGGKLAATTWGPRFFAPAYEVWNTAVQQVRPDLHAAYHPWDRITTPEALRALFRGAGVPAADVQPENGVQPLDTPEDFWTVVLGSGLRWTVNRLGPQGAEQVKEAVLARLAERQVDRLETNVIYAVAVRT